MRIVKVFFRYVELYENQEYPACFAKYGRLHFWIPGPTEGVRPVPVETKPVNKHYVNRFDLGVLIVALQKPECQDMEPDHTVGSHAGD